MVDKEKYDKILLSNISCLHTTKLGAKRIIKNIGYTDDIVNYLKNKIMDKRTLIYKKGKNYYCEIDNIRITVNASSLCIITAHVI